MHMRVGVVVMMGLAVGMVVVAAFDLGRHQMQAPVAHPGLGDGRLGELTERRRVPLQEDHLEAVFVVEMDVQRGEDQVVMGVLGLGQAAGQFTLVMVEDIAQAADRMQGVALLDRFLFEAPAQQVANGLRAVLVPFAANEAIEIVE